MKTSSSREKLRPTAEIAKARAKIFTAKLRVRELFKQLEYQTPHANVKRIAKKKTIDSDGEDDEAALQSESDDSGIDAEDIFCATCGRGDADDDDDILLCDGFCEGAYHMSCLDPPVTKQELAETGEDDDWMCRVCDARVDAFYALNAIASRHVDAATATWHDVFPEEAALDETQRGPGQANDPAKHFTEQKNAVLDEDWASDESDDEDFGGGGSFSDDGADDEDEPLSGSARSSSGSDPRSGDRGDEAESPEVLLGKRRRAPVDYRKLNDEMFGTGEAFEGEAEDAETGGWGPASPKKKKSAPLSVPPRRLRRPRRRRRARKRRRRR